ncbi:hypothetical protein C0J29_26505 [Mycobacterium paragordonae]|nr:hypothetical protein C0J29_26505 [Mycobacterium paragordonae]
MLIALETAPSLAEIRRLRNEEPSSWVRAALDRALQRWERSGAPDRGEGWISEASAVDLEDVRAQAIEFVTKSFLHEIRPLVTDINVFARDEIGAAFETSKTARAIIRIREFLQAIQRLNEAASSPQLIEFDLGNLIVEEIANGKFSQDQLVATRSDPVIVKGDPNLLKLALQNAFRNAVEASESTGKQVVVNCGASSGKAWVAILDEGIGLPESATKVWMPGVTKKSKEEHFGFGLPIARRAIHSLGGCIRLYPREHGGTACEILWVFEQQRQLEDE